jgi:hypothetical protein
MAVLMQDGDDFDLLVSGVWRVEPQRGSLDPLENVIKLVQESKPEANPPAFIPTRSLLGVKLRPRPGDKLAHQGVSPLSSFDRI